MAAGQGFKTFVTGEVLTAGDVNGYLMQGINVFASTAARDAAITAPAEGQFAFTKDTNGLWYYDGAAWVASGATGDIEGVTAGIGISGGGTSGTVTITNSMATAIDAKGDLVAGTGADTFSRLAVGANDTVLTADSTAATGLKWAAAASGGLSGLTLLNSGNTGVGTGTSKTWTGLGGYQNLIVNISGLTTGGLAYMRIEASNGTTLVNWDWTGLKNTGDTAYNGTNFNIGGGGGTDFSLGVTNGGSIAGFFWLMNAKQTGLKFAQAIVGPSSGGATTNQTSRVIQGYESTAGGFAISQLKIAPNTGSFSGGTVQIWGA